MIEQAVRVRVDLPGSGRVDVMAPANVPVAELVPEIIDIAAGHGIAVTDENHRSGWRLRLPSGAVAAPTDTLESASVRHGDRLTLVNEEAVLPEPLITDVSDVLADRDGTGVGVVDRPVACAIAAAAVIPVSVAICLSPNPLLAAGVAAVLTLGLAVALFVCVNRGGRRTGTAVTGVLAWQTAVLAGTTGVAVAGTGPGTWEFAAGLTLGLIIAAGLVGVCRQTAATAACTSLAFGATVVAVFRFRIDEPGMVWGLAVTVGMLALVVSPTLAVTCARRVRVPAVPAAGEPFPDEDHDGDPNRAAAQAGSLLDGAVTGFATVTALSSAMAVLSDPSGWTYALVTLAVIVMFIQSRGHARKIPSAALLVGAAVVIVAAAWHFWSTGFWPVALILVLLPVAATALVSLTGDGISPLARRLVEITETAAIAASLPLAAVIADVPRLLQSVLA